MSNPRHRLTFCDGALKDSQQSDTPQEGGSVQVGDVGLQRVLIVIGGRRNVFNNRTKERLEIIIIRQGAIRWLLGACSTFAARGINDGQLEKGVNVHVGNLIGEIAGEAQKQVLRFVNHLIDARVGPVGLVHQQNYGQLRSQRFTQNEPGLRKRPFARIHEKNDTINHAEAAFHLTAEVCVARSVDHVDRDRASPSVNTVIGDGGVLRQDCDAFFFFEVARVHGSIRHGTVIRKSSRLAQHGIHERGFTVVNVSNNRDVSHVTTGGNSHEVSFFGAGSAETSSPKPCSLILPVIQSGVLAWSYAENAESGPAHAGL